VTVPGRLFPVKSSFLESIPSILSQSLGYRPSTSIQKFLRSELNTGYGDRFSNNSDDNDFDSEQGSKVDFPYELYEALLAHLVKTKPAKGAILVFLPGTF
jgi:HrpA-like RNA helicase